MTQELTTTSILSLFETAKAGREEFTFRVIEALDSGHVDPLKVHLQVKCMEDIIKLLNSNTRYKSAVLNAAQSYGEKSFQFHNSKVEIKETGAKYDFSQSNDPVLQSLYEKQAALDAEVKARETMLKTVSEKGLVITDTETGDTFTVYPPAKSSTTNVVVTLK